MLYLSPFHQWRTIYIVILICVCSNNQMLTSSMLQVSGDAFKKRVNRLKNGKKINEGDTFYGIVWRACQDLLS